MQISIKPHKNISNLTKTLTLHSNYPTRRALNGIQLPATYSLHFTTETLEPRVIVAADSGIALGTAICLIKH